LAEHRITAAAESGAIGLKGARAAVRRRPGGGGSDDCTCAIIGGMKVVVDTNVFVASLLGEQLLKEMVTWRP
jgi:hypothetical protein